MKWKCLLLSVALAACGSSENLHTVEAACGYDKRPFPEAWPCVKEGAARLPGDSDLKRYYFTTGDVVAERIRAGQMTEAEGKLAMAKALTEVMESDNSRRSAAGSSYRPVVYQRVGPDTVIGY